VPGNKAYYKSMKDKNLDFYRGKIKPDLWRRMKAFCIMNGIKIHQFLDSAIEIKLNMENKENEK
jgi:hypothetical protein